MRRNAMRWLAALVFVVVACGGGDSGPSGGGPVPVGGGAAGTGGGTTGVTPGTTCAQGAAMPCTCADGASGTQDCQLDGTFSACRCAGGVPSGTPPAGGTAGAPAAMPDPGAGQAIPDPGGAIIVPPEDIASCNGAGTPPAPSEVVDVIQVRTDQVTWNGQTVPVVPGGFRTMAGTTYACFWADLDMPEKHHIIGWEGAILQTGGTKVIISQSRNQKP